MVGGGKVKADPSIPSIVFNRLFGLFLRVNFYLQSRSKEQLATHKADAISQRATIGKQISEVSASLEDIWMGMGCGVPGGFGRYLWMPHLWNLWIQSCHLSGVVIDRPETVALYIDGLTVQDNRTAAERATTEAVAEGVAAKRLGPMESTEINCTERISVDTDSVICQIGSAVHYYLSKDQYSQLQTLYWTSKNCTIL